MKRLVAALLFVSLLLSAQEVIDSTVNDDIRREVMSSPVLMRTARTITDAFGARLTGSPQAKAAADWAAWQLGDWGLQNVHLEPWDFAREGWSNDRGAAHLKAPVERTLVGRALPWTPGTGGVVAGPCVQIIPPVQPTQDEFSSWLAPLADTVRGAIVLVGARVDVNVTPPTVPADPTKLTASQVSAQIDRFLLENGALARLNDAGKPLGVIQVIQNSAYDVTRVPPTMLLRNEDYGRVSRLLEDGFPLEMEVEIASNSFPEGRTAWNVVAEIPGSDKANEVVMLGAHLDSLSAGTGATDNASGVAVMMEAVRILKKLGLQPRRTVRIALWSGEEQGLLGSRAYVRDHFGTAESPRTGFSTVSAYINHDAGTGRVTSLSVFGPAATASVLGQLVAPFKSTGITGATTYISRRLSGSDYSSFSAAGLPGITMVQDPLDYFTNTWHTNLDTFERLIEDNLKQAALIAASTVWHLATRDQLLPRFPPGQMPLPNTQVLAAEGFEALHPAQQIR